MYSFVAPPIENVLFQSDDGHSVMLVLSIIACLLCEVHAAFVPPLPSAPSVVVVAQSPSLDHRLHLLSLGHGKAPSIFTCFGLRSYLTH
jgi:hypothetical protein